MTSWARVLQSFLVAALLAAIPSSVGLTQSTQNTWDVMQPRGQTREIDFTTTEGTWMSVDLSPDGRWVVFDLLGHIYRVPVSGGQAECLTQNSGIALNYHPRYSPDGQEIAFISDRRGQDNLWVMKADGSDSRPVFLDEETWPVEPTWTPDGRSMVVTRRLRTEYGLYRTNDRIWLFPRDGGAGKCLVSCQKPGPMTGQFIGDPRYQSPSVSPDGRSVYYTISEFAGDNRRIQRVDLRTGQVDDVTENKFGYRTGQARPAFPLLLGEAAPEVSPNGRWLAFARRIPGGKTSFRGKEYAGRTALWLKDLETGAERVVMDPITTDAMTSHPPWYTRVLPGYSWARDSQSIVIAQGGKIRRVTIATGEVTTIPFEARVKRTISEMTRANLQITDDAFDVHMIRWPVSSPDGKQLVFEAVGQLWVMALPSGTPGALTTTQPAGVELTPAWSPDGRWVAYATAEDGKGGQLLKIRSDGGTPVPLTQDWATYLWPAWSPDGQSVVVNRWAKGLTRSQQNPQWELARIPAGGGPAVPLAKTAVLAKNGFGPEGRLFYTARRDDATWVLRSVSASGQDRRDDVVVGTVVPQRILTSPDGQWLVVQSKQDLYLLPYPKATTSDGAAQQPIDIEAPGTAAKRLSLVGGYFPHWRNPTTVEFISGNQYFAYHVDTGRTDAVKITLRIPRDVPTGTIALTGARIITLDQRKVVEQGTVVVKGSRITCVGDCPTTGVDRVVDVRGKTIIPGLMDLHAHHLREEPDGVIERQRGASGAYLANGVTTVRDPASDNEYSFTIGEMIEAGRITGPRTYTTGITFTCSDGPERQQIQRIRTLEDARQQVNRQANLGAVAIKEYRLCTRTEREMLQEATRERHLSITSEGADLLFNLGLIMGGSTGWEHPLQYVPIYRDVAMFLGQAGAHHTPNHLIADFPLGTSLEYWLGQSDLWNDRKVALWSLWPKTAARRIFVKKPLSEYFFPILAEGSADIKRAGGYIAMGDHGEQKGLGTHWEIWSNALAMTPMEALEAASMDAAHFLGLEKETGSITVGKLADLIVLNSNPLENIRHTIDSQYVMKAGKLYDALTLDELWPRQRPYGIRPWLQEDILRNDIRSDDHWDRARRSY